MKNSLTYYAIVEIFDNFLGNSFIKLRSVQLHQLRDILRTVEINWAA